MNDIMPVRNGSLNGPVNGCVPKRIRYNVYQKLHDITAKSNQMRRPFELGVLPDAPHTHLLDMGWLSSSSHNPCSSRDTPRRFLRTSPQDFFGRAEELRGLHAEGGAGGAGLHARLVPVCPAQRSHLIASFLRISPCTPSLSSASGPGATVCSIGRVRRPRSFPTPLVKKSPKCCQTDRSSASSCSVMIEILL